MRGFVLPDPEKISAVLFRTWSRILREADRQNLKRNQDIEMGVGSKLILHDENGTRWILYMRSDGTLEPTRAIDGLGATPSHGSFDSNFDGNFD